MKDNIINHPAVNWSRAESAYKMIQKREGQLLDHWIELGFQLNELRKLNPANQDFGKACEEHGIDLTHQHRKAAMWLATLDSNQLSTLRDYNPTALHPATLENRCREQFPEWMKGTRAVLHSVEDAKLPEPESGKPANEDPVASQEENPAEQKTLLATGTDDRSDAEVLAGHYSANNTRAFLGKMRPAPKKRLADLIRAGKMEDGNDLNTDKFSARWMVSGLPKMFASIGEHAVSRPNDSRKINAIIDQLDDYLAIFEKLGPDAKPKVYRQVWQNMMTQTQMTGVTYSNKPAPEGFVPREPDVSHFNLEKAMNQHPPRIEPDRRETVPQEIVVYGEQIWPLKPGPGEDNYTFEQAWGAWQLWKDFDSKYKLHNPDAEGRGRQMKTMNAWLEHAVALEDVTDGIKYRYGFAKAWWAICHAQNRYPDKASQTRGTFRKIKTK